MRFKSRLISIVASTILICLLCINCAYPELSPIKTNELKTAYMNGYVDALDLSIEYIKVLKKDHELLKKKVVDVANTYIVVVEKINSKPDFANDKNKKENPSSW